MIFPNSVEHLPPGDIEKSVKPQVLRDEIGTAMTNIKSRTDHTYMVRKGRERPRRDSSRKGVQMYV